jgi:hypothetical protein
MEGASVFRCRVGYCGPASVLRPAPYQSEEKLLVRYVIEEIPPQTRVVVPSAVGFRQAEIMQREKEILTSWDLAREVARTIGPDKILKKTGGGEDMSQAAALLKNNLRVSAPTGSTVLHLSFRHPDSALVQVVLREVVNQYFKLHAEVQRVSGDVALDKVTNISRIQSPSAPSSSVDAAALLRMQAVVVFAALLAAFVWILLERLTGSGMKLAR